MTSETEVFTIGVEEEFQIIDPETYALSSDVERILPRANVTLGETVKYELMLSQIEVATPICHTLGDVEAALTRQRNALVEAARQEGKLIAAASTHPFSPWYEQRVTPKLRYQQLISDYGQLIQEQVIFGCHVHVGLNDQELAIDVMNRARNWLPLLLGLSANSPFWHGADTRYASFRTGLWWTSPFAGPPPFFASRRAHDELIRSMVNTGSIEDMSRIYWDIRLPEHYKTIEFRVMDVCMTIDETLMIAGLIRALVRTCYEQAQQGQSVPEVSTELLKVATWHSARYGLENTLIDVTEERPVPSGDLIERFLTFLRPALEYHGDWVQVSQQVALTLARGNGATRQRAVFERTKKFEDVVQYIVDETNESRVP